MLLDLDLLSTNEHTKAPHITAADPFNYNKHTKIIFLILKYNHLYQSLNTILALFTKQIVIVNHLSILTHNLLKNPTFNNSAVTTVVNN